MRSEVLNVSNLSQKASVRFSIRWEENAMKSPAFESEEGGATAGVQSVLAR